MIFEAHGRVNLIGEHTDYNGGWVLPTAIPQSTKIILSPRSDQQVTVEAAIDPKTGLLRKGEFILGQEKPRKDWLDYIQGVTHILRSSGFSFYGFDLKIESKVPEGSGLSSSAALEISLLNAINETFSLSISRLDLARLGQKVENEFVGARVGIMDQMACSFARFGEALFLDTLHMTYRNVLLPLDLLDLVVINSGVSHNLSSGGGYNRRRKECEEACAILGVTHLRDLSHLDLYRIEILPEILRKRARHVITENERVHRFVEALENRDLETLGKLFYQSHASMKDDYEVSVPEIDLLVELCREIPEVLGARLTGGGFGGSIVALTQAGRGAQMADRVITKYSQQTTKQATCLVPQAIQKK